MDTDRVYEQSGLFRDAAALGDGGGGSTVPAGPTLQDLWESSRESMPAPGRQRALDRERFANVEKRRFITADIPGIGSVRIRSLNTIELRRVRAWISEDDSRFDVWELPLIVECLVDDDGNRIFRTSEIEAGTFDDWDAKVIRLLGRAINDHVGLIGDA